MSTIHHFGSSYPQWGHFSPTTRKLIWRLKGAKNPERTARLSSSAIFDSVSVSYPFRISPSYSSLSPICSVVQTIKKSFHGWKSLTLNYSTRISGTHLWMIRTYTVTSRGQERTPYFIRFPQHRKHLLPTQPYALSVEKKKKGMVVDDCERPHRIAESRRGY